MRSHTKPHCTDTFYPDILDIDCEFGAYLNVYMKDKNGKEVAFAQHEIASAKEIKPGVGVAKYAVSVLVCGKLYGKHMENVWKKLWKTFPCFIKQTSVGLILGIKKFIF